MMLRRLIAVALLIVAACAPARAASTVIMPTVGPMSFGTFNTNFLNPALLSLLQCNFGSTPPANGPGNAAAPWQCWVDTSTNPRAYKIWDGSAWIIVFTLDSTAHSSNVTTSEQINPQSGTSYPIVDGDRNKLILLSNSGSVAATIGQAGASGLFQAGWTADIKYTGSATATFTPTTSTIDGAASLTIQSGESVKLISDGTNYISFLKLGNALVFTGKTIIGGSFNGPVLSSPNISVPDNQFQFWANADNTKIAKFDASAIPTGTTRTYAVPGASTTLVGIDSTQTLTNKSIDGAEINSGTVAAPRVAQIDLSSTGNGGTGGVNTIAKGGTGQATALAARGSSGLNIDGCTSTGDNNYTILAADRCVFHTSLTAARTDTLPAANSVNAGQTFYLTDFRGAATVTNTITIQRAGSDTINGLTSVVAVNAAFGAAIYWSDGVSRWTFFPASAGGGGSGTVTAGGGGIVPTSGSPATLFVEQMTPGGRLTVASGVCAPTTDQVAQTTIYYAPCGLRRIPVYDGTDMKLRDFTSSSTDVVGLSIAMAASANFPANTIFRAFVGLDSGTLRLCTTTWASSGVGTSSTGSGGTTPELELFNGLLTNKNGLNCRYSPTTFFSCAVHQCTYVGDFMTSGTNGTVDLKFGTAAAGCGQAFLSVFNPYNRKLTRASLSNTTASWTYSSTTWRQQNASTTCNVQVVVGLPDETFLASNQVQMAATVSGAAGYIGIGVNSSSALAPRAAGSIVILPGGASSNQHNAPSLWEDALLPGLNQVVAIERGDGANNTTYVGSSAATNLTQLSFEGNM